METDDAPGLALPGLPRSYTDRDAGGSAEHKFSKNDYAFLILACMVLGPPY